MSRRLKTKHPQSSDESVAVQPAGVLAFRSRLILAFAASTTVLIAVFSTLHYIHLGRLITDDFDKRLTGAAQQVYSGPERSMIGLQHVENILLNQSNSSEMFHEIVFLASHAESGRLFASAFWPDKLHPALFTEGIPNAGYWKQVLAARDDPEARNDWPGRTNGFPLPASPRGELRGALLRHSPSGGTRGADPSPLERDSRGTGRGQRDRPPPSAILPLPIFHPFEVRKATTVSTEDGEEWRVIETAANDETFFVAMSTEPMKERRIATLKTFVPAFAIAMLLGIGTAFWFASRALRPIRIVTKELEAVSVKGLTRRIARHAHDREFVSLIDSFNQMLERLEESFGRSERFAASVAHQLRTPLTILGNQIDDAMSLEEPSSKRLPVLSEMMDEVDRLRRITDQLLLLSQAEAGHLFLDKESVNLSNETERLIEDMDALYPELDIQSTIEPGIILLADQNLVSHAILNLLTNAAKYNDHHQQVRVKLSRDGSFARLTVFNTGVPIEMKEASRIFDNYYRQGEGRRQHRDGLGLGLPLAREIIRAHGGKLRLVSSNSNGTTFQIKLPLEGTHGDA